MKKIFHCLDQKKAILIAIIAVGIFLRVYNFQDWLFFKMDQARDASHIKQALEIGPQYLPLLGPKAGGTELNLGPAFYYMQYTFAMIFQSAEPHVMAYPDLVLGIASIALFFLVLRRFFDENLSLLLTAGYSFCFLAVQYSRFSWNPNTLPFFHLLFFLSLLNLADEAVKNKLRWVLLAGASLAICTQLHFLSLFALPLIFVFFLTIARKDLMKIIGLREALVFFGVIALIYLPVIFHEIITHGENTTQFFAALKSKPSEHSLVQNIIRNIRSFGQTWFLILSSYVGTKHTLWGTTAAWLMFILPGIGGGIIFLSRKLRERKHIFIMLSLAWLLVYFLAYIPIAYQLRPRFFLPIIFLPFIFLGYSALAVKKYAGEASYRIFLSGIALIAVFNLVGVMKWFGEMRESEIGPVAGERTIILKAQDGVVLAQLSQVSSYFLSECPSKQIYYISPAEYERPLDYLLSLQGASGHQVSELKQSSTKECFFGMILTRQKVSKLGENALTIFDVVTKKKIGAVTVFKLKLKDSYINQNLPTFKKSGETIGNSKKLIWKDLKL